MVSIVIVSHSKTLSQGVKELALQMSQGKVHIEATGGIDDKENLIGTDPQKIENAIKSAYSQDGVLVLMDIGSAIMSAEIAIEKLTKSKRQNVFLCEAPLVEGAIAAAAQAMAGSTIETVATEAKNALNAKVALLYPEEVVDAKPLIQDDLNLREGKKIEIVVPNRLGLHARPAAKLVGIASMYDAKTWVGLKSSPLVSATSISQVSTLGAKKGDTLIFRISGNESNLVEKALLEFAIINFGDRENGEAPPTKEIHIEGKGSTQEGVLYGTPASAGIAIGKAMSVKQVIPEVKKMTIEDTSVEIISLEKAIDQVRSELKEIKTKVSTDLKKSKAQIFDFHLLLLNDRDFKQSVIDQIQQEKINTAYAWIKHVHKLVSKYRKMDTLYMKERAQDITEVGNKVLLELLGKKTGRIVLSKPGIIVADELGPAETVTLDTKFVKGIITRTGGETSHSAILARSLGIPAIVGVGESIESIIDSEELGMDGSQGAIWLSKFHPQKIENLKTQKEKDLKKKFEVQAKAKVPAMTKDDKIYPILANVSGPKEAKIAFENGADGIGLYRTEFLFMNRDTPPSEEEQYQAYMAVCENMQGLPVTIRTLDVGGDKPIPYLGIEKEKNPFLGLRGIRYCLHNKVLFTTQLRAICRVSATYPVRVMYPMVGVPEEVEAANEVLRSVQKDLQMKEIPYDINMEVGIMIEVPSAIFCVPALAEVSDFFSIGTNDLTQYLLALDRGNTTVAKYRSALHPSVLQAIQEVIYRSKDSNIEIGMCGELAGNPKATSLLVNMGLEKFSMNSPAIPGIKELIRQMTATKNQDVPQAILNKNTLAEVKESINI